jgi:glycosyltransferase involved in cell wall biosynthesis
MNKKIITLINGYELEKRNSMNIYLSNLYGSLITINIIDNIFIHKLNNPHFHKRKFFYIFEKYFLLPIKLMRFKTDIIHIVDHTYSHIIKYFWKTKIIITVHDIIPILSYNNKIKGLTYPHNPLLFKFSIKYIRKADAIITVSECTKKDIIEIYKINPKKIHVIHPGIDDSFKLIETELQEKIIKKLNLQFPKINKFILLSGSTDYKNHKIALQVIRKFIDHYNINIYFILTGKLNVNVLNIINSYNLDYNYINIESISNAEMPYLYNYVDCLFFPSLYEGFGFPILESMACGTPVLTSNSGSIPEIAADAAVMHNPLHVIDFCNSLFKILYDQQFRSDLIKKGLINSKKFSWENTAEKTNFIYKNIFST